MKVSNMTSSRGNSIPNQFVISEHNDKFINGMNWRDRETERHSSPMSLLLPSKHQVQHLTSRTLCLTATNGTTVKQPASTATSLLALLPLKRKQVLKTALSN